MFSSSLLFACSSGNADDDDDTPDAFVNLPDAAVSIDAYQAPDAPPGAPDAAPKPDAMPTPDADTTDADTTDADPLAPDADTTDALDSDACLEFTTPDGTISTYPGTFDGDLNDASATQIMSVDEGDCELEIAPDGVLTPGAEQVVMLSNLVAGTTYGVRLTPTDDDLGFYVATSCTGDDGPAAGECLAYVDAGLEGEAELGAFDQPTFVAPAAGVAYVIVDRYYADPPGDGTYTLEVFVAECDSIFDCENSAEPVCDFTTLECVAGPDDCVGDDDAENEDDGPAGATPVTFGTPLDANVCNSPEIESDWYSYTATGGEQLLLSLEWTDDTGAEMYAVLWTADGEFAGYVGGETSPSGAIIAEAEAGDYFVEIYRYGTGSTAVTPYTFSITEIECFGVGVDCTSDAAPVCVDYECVASPATTCTSDDAVENLDDGAAHATVVAPTLDGGALDTTAHICSDPTGTSGYSLESDFYAVTIGDGEVLDVSVSWTGDEDLDIFIYDEDGFYVDEGTSEVQPEVYSGTGLDAGTYYIEVWKYSNAGAAATIEYIISIARTTAT